MDLPANHAGGFREYLTLVCRQPARNWLVELHCAIIYCLQRERRGLGRHGKRLSSLNPDDDLLDELSDALAARVVCESMDADPLSPSSIERLMQKYVKSCSKTRSESITRIKSALTCLWNLCQNIYINDDRKLVDGSILSADSYELLCELVGLSGEWGPPSVLERALVQCNTRNIGRRHFDNSQRSTQTFKQSFQLPYHALQMDKRTWIGNDLGFECGHSILRRGLSVGSVEFVFNRFFSAILKDGSS